MLDFFKSIFTLSGEYNGSIDSIEMSESFLVRCFSFMLVVIVSLDYQGALSLDTHLNYVPFLAYSSVN